MIFASRPGLYLEPWKGGPLLAGSDQSREPSTIRLVLEGPMAAADAAALCERLALLDRRGADLVICDLGSLSKADLGTIDALLRLQLTSRRLGCRMGVRNAPAGLRELLTLAGLGRVVRLLVEASGQAEEREESLGVQKEGDPADPPT